MKFILSALKPTRKKFVVLGAAGVGLAAVKMYFGSKPADNLTGTHADKPPTGTSGSADKGTSTMSTNPKATTGAKPGSTPSSTATDTDPKENPDDKPAQPGPVDALTQATDNPSALPSNGNRLTPRPAPASNGTRIHTPTNPAATDATHDGPGLLSAAKNGPKPDDEKPGSAAGAAKVKVGTQS